MGTRAKAMRARARLSRATLVALALAACGPDKPAPITPIVAERPASTLQPATQDLLWDLRLPVIIHAYFSEGMPEPYAAMLPTIRTTVEAFASYNGSKVTRTWDDPFSNPNVQQYAHDRFRVDADKLGEQPAYFAIVIEVGRQVEVLSRAELAPGDTLADVESLIRERIRSAQDERTTW